MNMLLKPLFVPALAVAILAGIPAIANACVTCTTITACGDDNKCTSKTTCAHTAGNCP